MADAISVRLRTLRSALAIAMERAGLTADLGWRVHEDLRSTARGSRFVFRPIHSSFPSPEGFELSVEVDNEGRLVPPSGAPD